MGNHRGTGHRQSGVPHLPGCLQQLQRKLMQGAKALSLTDFAGRFGGITGVKMVS